MLRDGYAQTETGLVLGNLIGSVANAGAVGVSLPGHDMAVVGGGEELAAGDEGELAVRGRPPSLFAGYAGDSTTPPGFRGDWYLTGDRAVRDEAGLFWLSGRSEDSIAAPGATVGALEVEAALLRHSAVADAAAVQAGGGERRGAKAFVVPTPRAEPGDELADTLREHARHAAGVRAVPAEIEFVAALPRTAAWKLNRVELRRGEHARPADPAEAAWPEPARLVVPQPRTLEFEPEPQNLESEPEPEPQPDVLDPVELHAASEPEPHSRVEPEPEPSAEPEPEPSPYATPSPSRSPSPLRSPENRPLRPPTAASQRASPPTASGHHTRTRTKTTPERAGRHNVGMSTQTIEAPVRVEERETEDVRDADRPWIVIVWNDPINLMSYVTFVFQKLFGYSKARATKLMLQVHEEGKAVVSSGTREKAELDVAQLHGHGLWATLQQD